MAASGNEDVVVVVVDGDELLGKLEVSDIVVVTVVDTTSGEVLDELSGCESMISDVGSTEIGVELGVTVNISVDAVVNSVVSNNAVLDELLSGAAVDVPSELSNSGTLIVATTPSELELNVVDSISVDKVVLAVVVEISAVVEEALSGNGTGSVASGTTMAGVELEEDEELWTTDEEVVSLDGKDESSVVDEDAVSLVEE